MFSSLFSANYAIYASNKTCSTFFSETPQHPNPSVFIPNFYRRAMDGKVIVENIPRNNEVSNATEKVKSASMKFSIQNILGSGDPKEDRERDECVEPRETAEPEGEGQSSSTAEFPWLQCTRYKPPKLQRIKKKEGVRKRKLGRNPRVPFSQHQVAALEQKFRRTRYLSSMDVAELSASLNLTETRVKIWFQNRRARERRDRVTERDQLLQNKPFLPLTGLPLTGPAMAWSYSAASDHMVQFRQPILFGGSAFSPVAYPKLGGK
ncbi:hypothetical protein ScPMuIL_013913 [Solemya velum]